MAKPLRHTKAGTTEVQRLLCHHIDQARKALRGHQPLSDAAVHGARKQLKKGRADLRLLRKALVPQTYHYENTTLRDVARPLTTVRDARVLMDTLERLVEHGGAQAQAHEQPIVAERPARLCRKVAFKTICAMVSPGTLRWTEREDDDGDQFQGSPFSAGYHPHGG